MLPEWAETLGRIALPLALVALFIWLSFRSNPRKLATDGPEDEPYRVYTSEYDQELRADHVVALLPSVSPDHKSGFLAPPAVWQDAVAEMEEFLADQRGAFDMERHTAELSEAASGLDPQGVVAALLIDQSGSMKGRPIASVAATVTLLAELLSHFGARVEILGFSTAGWRGGHARLKWLNAGRPKRPGRLCALMHVIYKSAEEDELGAEASRVIVHPDLLRENLDGEAIQWARERLAGRTEPHKLLMVISDGAPVDDSTLAANGPSYLHRHLKTVLRDIEAEGSIIIGGVGINHDTHAFYWLAETAPTPADVPEATMNLLKQMLRHAVERELDGET